MGSLSGNIAWLKGSLQSSSSWSKSPFYNTREQISNSLVDPDLIFALTRTGHINDQASMGLEAMGLEAEKNRGTCLYNKESTTVQGNSFLITLLFRLYSLPF